MTPCPCHRNVKIPGPSADVIKHSARLDGTSVRSRCAMQGLLNLYFTQVCLPPLSGPVCLVLRVTGPAIQDSL